MENSIERAFKIFKYLSIFFTIVYWIYIVIDDYVFIEKYWDTNWLDYLGIWTIYFFVYFVAFSICFWLISMTLILVYHKIIKRVKDKKTTDANYM